MDKRQIPDHFSSGQRYAYRFEHWLFQARWLLAPFYIGVILALILLLVKFVQQFFLLMPTIFALGEKDLILEVLSLVDLALVANLILMVAFVGYDQFVSSFDTAVSAEEKPKWLTSTGYHGIKLKAMGSIGVICAIELLRVFLNIEDYSEREIAWRVAIMLTISVSGLILAIMDRITHDA